MPFAAGNGEIVSKGPSVSDTVNLTGGHLLVQAAIPQRHLDR